MPPGPTGTIISQGALSLGNPAFHYELQTHLPTRRPAAGTFSELNLSEDNSTSCSRGRHLLYLPGLCTLLERGSGTKAISASPLRIGRNTRDPWMIASQQLNGAVPMERCPELGSQKGLLFIVRIKTKQALKMCEMMQLL